MRLRFPSLYAPFVLVGLTVTLVACANPERAPTAPMPTTISPLAAAYLEEVVTLLQRHSVKRRTIDWTAFRAEVVAAAGPAQTISEAVPGIRRALALLGDGHSVYIPLRGSAVSVPTRSCRAPTIGRTGGTPNVGYVRVRNFSGPPAEATLYAQRIQDSIRVTDRDGIVGWIVDLRGNAGGNMWPMIAGIGPILGEGVVGHFLDADSTFTPYSYRDGASASGDTPLHQVSSVYRLKRPNPRVAVLTDGWVASSGEAVAIAFRERPDTRSFGTATCGLSTGNTTYWLSDTSRLVITAATMADRKRLAYGDVIPPDEVVANPDDTVSRAIEWLTFATGPAGAVAVVRER